MHKSLAKTPQHLHQLNRPQQGSSTQRQPLHPILHLQQTIGNKAVLELLRTQRLQRTVANHTTDELRDHARSPRPHPSQAFSLATRGVPQEIPFRGQMEAAFGQSFRQVEAHLGDQEAIAGLAQMNARAATFAHKIAFDTAQPTAELVAHELAHVAQARLAGNAHISTGGATEMSLPGSASEREAVVVATQAVAGHRVQIRQRAMRIQRDARTSGVDVLGMSRDVGELNEKVAKLIELQESLRKAAEIIRHRKGDTIMAEAAGNLLSAADNLTNVVHVYQEFTDQFHHLPTEEINKRLHEAAKAVQWLDAASKLHDRETMKAFIEDKEDPDKAKTWAKDVGEIFTAISEALPDNIPFVSKMLKGYLAAPANYIKAFNNILDAYLAKIDLYTGSGDQAKAFVSGKLEFIGSLASTYHLAPYDLQQFMFTHKDVGGINLEKVSKVLGISHLLNLIQQSYVPGGEGGPGSVSLEQKTKWLEFLGRQM